MSDTSIKLAHIVGAGPRILSALTQLCERGPGEPDAPSGDALSLPTRLVVIAHATEAVLQQHGQAGAVAHIRRAGGQLDGHLVRAFVDGQRDLFTAIEDPQIFDRFLDLEPTPIACADEHGVDDVARVLATLRRSQVSDVRRALDRRGGARRPRRRPAGPQPRR
jgi:hypothetical protein